jgi:hypothetical protein
MSEQNILNPSASDQKNPTYSIPHKDPQIMASWQPRSGKPFDRYMLSRGMEFQLHWEKVQYSTYESLLQWFHQYERSFFSYFNFQRNRYFSGKFLAEPQFEEVGNNQYNISATFVEVPGVAMFQYPSTWGVTSIFLEERDDYAQDLVKLTGTWDHGDKNYCPFSEQFDNGAWLKTNAVVTANAVNDPNGNPTADSVAFSVTGATALLAISAFPSTPVAGQQFTFSCWMKAASGTPSLSLKIQDQASGLCAGPTAFVLSTAWQRFSVTGVMLNTSTSPVVFLFSPTSNTIAYHLWGAQLEYGAAQTTYVTTTNAAVVLPAPNQNAKFHSGFAYHDAGTVTTDAAEWGYFGYGFRLWAPKGPDMGIVQVFLDGVSQGNVDLFAAAATASAVVLTVQSVALGLHRVKLQPTNTKNAASTNFVVTADAIEVMR